MSNRNSSRRLLLEVWNNRNFAVIDELVAKNFVSHDPFSGDQGGPQSQKDFVEGMVTAFPDVNVEILSQEDDGDMVVTRVEFTGTHTGTLYGPQGDLLPTNRVAVVPVTIRDRYKNGMVVESWAEWNPVDMLAQLGVQM